MSKNNCFTLIKKTANDLILKTPSFNYNSYVNLAEAAGDPNRKQTNQLHVRFSENIVLLVAGYCRNSRTGEI